MSLLVDLVARFAPAPRHQASWILFLFSACLPGEPAWGHRSPAPALRWCRLMPRNLRPGSAVDVALTMKESRRGWRSLPPAVGLVAETVYSAAEYYSFSLFVLYFFVNDVIHFFFFSVQMLKSQERKKRRSRETVVFELHTIDACSVLSDETNLKKKRSKDEAILLLLFFPLLCDGKKKKKI